MEDIGAAQVVASPVFMGRHQSFAPTPRFCDPHPVIPRKRSLSSFPAHPQKPPPSAGNWNPKQWEWDSARFVARQRDSSAMEMNHQDNNTTIREEIVNVGSGPVRVVVQNDVAESEDLQLKLGGGETSSGNGNGSSGNSADEGGGPVSSMRPNKRVRSGSPGTASYPMCQVDNCKEDLSHAKDYHRRHKVCELHSKATKALVAKQMQRFCQQCSRFHPLTEFDEGKRSCRRRLAGHNRRRRKTQPEDAASRVVVSGNQETTGNGDLNIVNLLAVLARAQGNMEGKGTNGLSMPDKDQLLQILTKINTLPLPANLVAKLPIFGNQTKINANQLPSVDLTSLKGSTSPSTMNLIAALSGTPAVHTPSGLETPPERSSQGSDSEKTNSAYSDQVTCLNLNAPAFNSPCVGGERSSSSEQSPVDDSDSHVEDMQPNVPLQLFSSSPEEIYPPKLPAGRKYFSSDSSNPSEERSPSYSPPVAQTLFPVHASRETLRPVYMSSGGHGDANFVTAEDSGCDTSLQLFAGSPVGADVRNPHYQAGYASSSVSDHSPSSMNSDNQDRTGRIIFKLFDKDPSHLPGALRDQIHSWLSNSPSEMESYIRPGCVVLSVYVSMSLASWDQFDGKLLHYLKTLIQDFNTDFWAAGRFLICTEKQLASHVDGKLRIHKSLKAWCSPELLYVTPLAVVGGQETSLLLRGRNLNISGTKINCSHTADYTVKDVSGLACEESEHDVISLCNFTVSAADSSVFGRCFIEVENGLKVSSFPVIIADELICQELRLLEYDIGKDSKVDYGTPAHDLQGHHRRSGSREEVLHFLNELGWLFQRKCNSSFHENPNYKISRFKFLLIFSVEHNFCFLVRSLLDILLEINLDKEDLRRESLEMLSEIHLLNRAIQKKHRSMIDLLLNYSVVDASNGSKIYFFTPNSVGPGGVTPLHLVACTSRSEDLVDALTSDPREIGLRCWKSLQDASGVSPFGYAAMSNNHSYNRLVAQKLSMKENRQVSVSFGSEIELESLSEMTRPYKSASLTKRASDSCSKCASAAARCRKAPGSRGLLDRPYIHSMLAIAAVCVCVCIFFRGAPDLGVVAPFKWENLDYGSM